MRERTQTRSERKRQAILETARAMFRENGVQGSSMDALAYRAGVSKRTVYNHFPSKEALVLELLSAMRDQARQRLHVKYDGAKPLEPQLLTLVGSEIELACNTEYLDLARMAAGHFFYRPEALRETADGLAEPESGLLRWLEAAVNDGRIAADDPVFAAAQLNHLVKGACFWPQLTGIEPIPERDEQRRIAEETVAMFLARYGTG